jgi:opacity protein-like surface antigen
MKLLSARLPLWCAIASLLAIALASPAVTNAQKKDKDSDANFGGWYFGGHAGMNFAGYDVDGYTMQLAQTSGINVQTRGIIIVPGTTVNIPKTSTGGSVDFTVPTCVDPSDPITGFPLSITCTGNKSLGTLALFGSDPITAPGSRSKGFLGGGQIGYNKQFVRFVIGAEGEFSGSSVNGTSQVFQVNVPTALTNCVGTSAQNPCTPTVTTFTRAASSHWTSSLNVRAGWIWHRTLIYGTGGPAIASVAVNATDTFNPTLSNSGDCPCGSHSGSAQRSTGIVSYIVTSTGQDSHIQFGWTAGIGIERSLWRHLRWGVEYRHSDLGNKTYPGTLPTSIVVNPSMPVSVTDDSITDSHGRPFLAGGIFSPPAKVSYVEDRISARFNFHF